VNAPVNRVAIVTGASSGIGRATASLFSREGAKVVVAARRQQELDELVDDITRAGGTAIAVAGDVKDEAVTHALVEAAVRRFGGLDIAFNNAGTLGSARATTEVATQAWRDTIDTDLTSASSASLSPSCQSAVGNPRA
jgi:NAD(P)-dependent dehydrogenase (short-subunit alcohol dehydrogenase family)